MLSKEEVPTDRQTNSDTTPAQSKKHTLKHDPNSNSKPASIYGKEKGFPLPPTVNSHPSFLVIAHYLHESKPTVLLEHPILHKHEPEIFDKKKLSTSLYLKFSIIIQGKKKDSKDFPYTGSLKEMFKHS